MCRGAGAGLLVMALASLALLTGCGKSEEQKAQERQSRQKVEEMQLRFEEALYPQVPVVQPSLTFHYVQSIMSRPGSSLGPTSTHLQRSQAYAEANELWWQYFQGRRVRWKGKVESVVGLAPLFPNSPGGNAFVGVQCGSGIDSPVAQFHVPYSQAIHLQKGQLVTIEGTLFQYSGMFFLYDGKTLSYTLTDGRVVRVQPVNR